MTAPTPTRPTLPAIDHASRVHAVQSSLGADGSSRCDAVALVDLVDIRWLTGFTGSNGWVVVRPDVVVLGTDGRYGDRARAETAGAGVEIVVEQDRGRLQEAMVAALASSHRVALDPTDVTHDVWSRLVVDVPLEPVASIVTTLRSRKDPAEIARIEAAAAAADAALADVEPMLLATVDDPVSEADIRDELEYRMRRHGADDRSYDTIVATGPEHAARPHHEVSRRTIVEGDTVVIDVGALVDGYHSDMTRCWVIGDPTARQREVHALVAQSHAAGLDAVRAGLDARELDRVCRDVFVDAGYGDWFVHGTGHGVGLDIHERPFHHRTSTETIPAGGVVTVEPGLYRDGFGGFRIEDLVVVTETGHRVLTHHPQRALD